MKVRRCVFASLLKRPGDVFAARLCEYGVWSNPQRLVDAWDARCFSIALSHFVSFRGCVEERNNVVHNTSRASYRNLLPIWKRWLALRAVGRVIIFQLT